MTKAAIIIERTDVALGGAERSVFELASQLTRLGVDVTTLAAKGESSLKKVVVLCDGKNSKRTSLSAFESAIKSHLVENHYDIIHSTLPFDFADIYQPRGGSYAETIVRNAASYSNKIVSSYKMITHFANRRRYEMLRAERKLCANGGITVIAALSEYVKQQFQRHYGLSDERIKVIPNGIKVNKKINTRESDKLRAQILDKLGMAEADEPALFLFAANNFRLKGLAKLIKALKPAAKQGSDRPICLVVAGTGSSEKYRHLAKKLGVSDRIVFLGRLRHIQNALAISDAAVLPTYYDPCSRFILEALDAGRAVITTRFNGASEMFTDNRHGRIIDSPDDIEGLIRALNYYSITENIQKARQAITEDDLRETISIKRHAKQIVELYRKLEEKN